MRSTGSNAASSRWILPMTGASSWASIPSVTPMRSVSALRAPPRATRRLAWSASASISLAVAKNSMPSSVRRTERVLRTSSEHPSSVSRAWIWWLTVGCDTCSASAALENESCEATSTKHESCMVFTGRSLHEGVSI